MPGTLLGLSLRHFTRVNSLALVITHRVGCCLSFPSYGIGGGEGKCLAQGVTGSNLDLDLNYGQDPKMEGSFSISGFPACRRWTSVHVTV